MDNRMPLMFDRNWKNVDQYTENLDRLENERQQAHIIMIAALSICPRAVREAVASSFCNIDAEGSVPTRMKRERLSSLLDLPHQMAHYRRYADDRSNKCTEYANIVEAVAQQRLARLFATDSTPAERIFANIQPPTGAIANTAVFDALLDPGDAIVAMSLAHGGHLSHGSTFHRSGKYYRAIHYGVDLRTGKLDYGEIEELVRHYHPKLVIAGASSYPWEIDWARLRKITDNSAVETYLMADIAHPAGLVVAGLFPNPIDHAHVTTLVTYKTLCGPRGAAILTTSTDLARRIDRSLFPGLLGAPLLQNIVGMAVAFEIASSEEFRRLQKRIVENAQALAASFAEQQIEVAYGGTNTHLVLVSLKHFVGADGGHLQGEAGARVLEQCGIVCNKNVVPGDTDATDASGLRFGTTWCSQLGMDPEHMHRIARTVSMVLHDVRPFCYRGLRSDSRPGQSEWRDIPRGKIAFETLREARMQVRQILRGVHALGDSHPSETTEEERKLADTHPLTDLSSVWLLPKSEICLTDATASLGLLEVCGHKAKAFLQIACTCDMFRPIQSFPARSLVLDEKGRILSDAIIFNVGQDQLDRDRFILAAPMKHLVELVEWFEALSDGHVHFGFSDILAKVDGPVVIHRLQTEAPYQAKSSALLIWGHDSDSIATGLLDTTQLERKQRYDLEFGSISACLAKYELLDMPDSLIAVFVPPDQLETAARLIQDTADRKGIHFETVRYLPESSERGRVDSGPWPLGTVVEMRKPFFVGRNSLPAITEQQDVNRSSFQPVDACHLHTPLYDEHIKLGARMTSFAGWDLPAWYTGIVDEHRAVRSAVAIFDIGHMGVIEITGEDATWFLDSLTTNYMPTLQVGWGFYSFLLDPSGSVIDDCYIYRLGKSEFMMVVNAINAERVLAWLKAVQDQNCLIDVVQPQTAILPRAAIRDLKHAAVGDARKMGMAIQGPQSLRLLQGLTTSLGQRRVLANLERNQVISETMDGIDLILSRTGYTGEQFGYEVYLHPDQAPELWERLLSTGRDLHAIPAGLACRDSARIEAGFPLHGQELAGPNDISPIEAGYPHIVKFHKTFFVGRSALLERELTRSHEIVRFAVARGAGRPVRSGDRVVDSSDNCIGHVTSSTIVSALQVGLAYVTRDNACVGDSFGIDRSRPSKTSTASPGRMTSRRGADVSIVEAKVLPRFGPILASDSEVPHGR